MFILPTPPFYCMLLVKLPKDGRQKEKALGGGVPPLFSVLEMPPVLTDLK